MTALGTKKLILASQSVSRRRLLDSTGLEFAVKPSHVNESVIKDRYAHEGVEAVALRLARAKAGTISRRHPESLVIGADQILEKCGQFYDKPASVEALADYIMALQGEEHSLVSATVVLKGGEERWRHISINTMRARTLTYDQAQTYAQRHPEACQAVGGYQLERGGLALLDACEGDYFSILGLPLMALLLFLRQEGIDVI